MSSYIIYELDEFQPWPGQACYLYGTAMLTYKWEKPDPSIGWRGGPTNIRLQSLVISGDGESMIVPRGSHLFDAAASTLEASDFVAAQCVKDHENGA